MALSASASASGATWSRSPKRYQRSASKRVWVRSENILDYATTRQYRNALNPAYWRGHLDKLLPKPSQVKTVRHHPAMPYSEVPAFMTELAGKGSGEGI